MATQKLCRPRRCTKAELARAGVDLADGSQPLLRCMKCGSTWSPQAQKGRLPRGYWRCAKGCNEAAEKY